MNCPSCGARLDHPGQGHTCEGGSVPVTRPPRRWQVSFAVVLVLALAFAVLSLMQAAISAGLLASPIVLSDTRLSFAVPLSLLIAFLVWSNLTRGIVEGYGGLASVVRNWAMSWGALVLFLSYLVPATAPTAFQVARALAAILFIVGLLISRLKLRRWLAEPAGPAGNALQPGVDGPPQQRRNGPRFAGMPPPAEVQVKPRDWDASVWDPEIQADIERRRRGGGPPA